MLKGFNFSLIHDFTVMVSFIIHTVEDKDIANEKSNVHKLLKQFKAIKEKIISLLK